MYGNSVLLFFHVRGGGGEKVKGHVGGDSENSGKSISLVQYHPGTRRDVYGAFLANGKVVLDGGKLKKAEGKGPLDYNKNGLDNYRIWINWVVMKGVIKGGAADM